MDNNVYRILLGASGAGGINPQIMRFNWSTDSVIHKPEYTNLLYLGHREATYAAPPFNQNPNGANGTIISVDGAAGTINWTRKVQPGGYAQFSKYYDEGSNVRGLTNNGYFYTFPISNGSLSSGLVTGTITQITDTHYVLVSGNQVRYINRSDNTGWYSGIDSGGFGDDIMQTAWQVGSYVYSALSHRNDSEQWDGIYYGRHSLSDGSYTLLTITSISNYKILGVSSNNSYFYAYIPLSGPAGNQTVAGYVSMGIVVKLNVSNGNVVWYRTLQLWYYGGFNNYATKDAIFDPETEDVYLLGHWRTNNNDDGIVPMWKVNSNGNTEWVRQTASGLTGDSKSGQPQRISLDADNMYLVGSNYLTDNGYGPGIVYVFPKDGSLTGTHGVTTYSDTLSSYNVSTANPVVNRSQRGFTNPKGSVTLSSSSPTNTTNSIPTDGYVFPIS